ncbi:MAG: amidohydrolase family protein, partial [Candidatus Sericytochromatia bacterium]
IASLQFGLPSVWTRARSRGFSLSDLTRLMSANTARLPNLQSRKGSLEVGKDADLVVFDPDAEFTVTPDMIHFKHPVTPYAAQVLTGVVERTYLRGQLIYAHGQHQGQAAGEFLLKK